jgi:glutathionylspermidine synthase
MQRIAVAERPHWRARAGELGFHFHSPDGTVYWDERAYYAFDAAAVETHIEDATRQLDDLCRSAVDRIVRDDRLMTRLGLPALGAELVRASWRRNDPSLYGRFDFAYDGTGPGKLLEYNADTPTSLYEAAVFQWFWLEDQLATGGLPPGTDQYNAIHETLVARLADLAGQGTLHLSSVAASVEDRGTIDYIAECAVQGGFTTRFIAVEDIGLGSDGQFYDLQHEPIERLFKLYPWEWLFNEPFARGLASSRTAFLEPAWRVLLSNKGILPILWEMAPGHANLLEAYFSDDPRARRLEGHCARKPLYSREGANVTLHRSGALLDADGGPYGAEGFIVQALAPLPSFAGNYPVVGAWTVAGRPCGMGVREDLTPITKNTSRFLPHVLLPDVLLPDVLLPRS